MNDKKNDAKKVFLKKGTCSRTFSYILNREFGNVNDDDEGAIDPLAGGIVGEGYQCGMLWGASLAVGTECYKRYKDTDEAITYAIWGTQSLLESFVKRTNSANCSVITSCDFTSNFGLAKYFITGKPLTCFNLADKWAPEAIDAAHSGLSLQRQVLSQTSISCASEVVKKMGGSEQEMVMVAGFAGGYGLSGNACGALSAAIWMSALERVREKKYKYSLSDPQLEKMMNAFFEETGYKMECFKICQKRFDTIDEHTEFIKNGGCGNLINLLAKM